MEWFEWLLSREFRQVSSRSRSVFPLLFLGRLIGSLRLSYCPGAKGFLSLGDSYDLTVFVAVSLYILSLRRSI